MFRYRLNFSFYDKNLNEMEYYSIKMVTFVKSFFRVGSADLRFKSFGQF